MAPLHQILVTTRNHGIGGLNDVDPAVFAHLEHLLFGEVGHADEADLALLFQEVQRSGGLLEGHVVIRPVDEVEVDVIGLQAAKALLALIHEVGKRGVAEALLANGREAALMLQGRGADAAFGGHEDLGTIQAFQRAGADLLGITGAIDGRGVNQVDAAVEHRANRRDGIFVVDVAVAERTNRPCSDRKSGSVNVRVFKVFVTHNFLSSFRIFPFFGT